MRLETEAELVQNSTLGAMLLWAFVAAFFEQTGRRQGPLLPFSLPVLPMVLHQETVETLHRRQREGGLDLALAENRTLSIDLQDRMESMEPQSLRALNVAFAAGLLSYKQDKAELLPERLTVPFPLGSEEIRRMLHTAERLGYWFSTINSERLCSLLRIRL